MRRFGKSVGRSFQNRGLRVLFRRPLTALVLIVLGFGLYRAADNLTGPPSFPAKVESSELSGQVTRVNDGDTLSLKTSDGQKVKVRLFGVDAPELHQKYGQEAHKYLASQVAGRQVRVEVEDIDQYDRLVGKVFVGETCLNELLVATGRAWVFERYCRGDWCDRLKSTQKQARRDRLGLWREKNPQPPWVWRQKNPRN